MDGDTQLYFSPDYATARRRFQETARRAGAVLEALELDARGPAGEDLAIDVAHWGTQDPRRALLHSSGLHGVEGFAGSAIQLQLLQDVPRLAENTALIIVHVLNPFGMAWLRRVNENSVDLNRNSCFHGSYAGAPSAYAKLDSFLNPQSPPSSDFFLVKAASLILRYGMATLKQSIAGGQYEYPKGLFFGGKRLEQGLERYQAFLRRRLGSVEAVLAIDVHTGLGKYAEDTLLVAAEDYDRLGPIFGKRVRAMEAKRGPAYRPQGGLADLLSAALPQAHVDFIGQEFGTYNPVKVLHALREENRWHHYGSGTVPHPTKRALKQAFCPDDESWRRAVLKRGRELVEDGRRSLL
ncbi:MAG TPA: DUF2817 domain-containing protein [Terriglobia bacterium]|nr:DUF2817 domain-containing protein [Terriglobia bacterium]